MLIAAVAAATPNASPLDVQMTLSSDTILLGEPLWVDVRVTNRSSTPLSVDMGNNCFGAKPIVIEVPQADPHVDRERRCGVVEEGGNCLMQEPQELAAGASLSKRYVFDGDFRITHDGRYIVRLTKKVRYGPQGASPAPIAPMLPDESPSQTTVVDTTLDVLPANPPKLLEIERNLAARATATLPPEEFPPQADIETVRRVVNKYHAAAQSANEVQTSIMDGIAAYPAAGMEPFFAARLETTHGSYRSYQAAMALYNLNTPQAREDLAKSTDGPATSSTWFEVQYLGFMGDPSYLPLLERLSSDADAGTRQQAVLALGILGGESELPRLESLEGNATNEADRNNAIMALGFTATLKAVPFLLSLLDTPSLISMSGNSLFLLTHHQLSSAEYRTTQFTAVAWKTWWDQNQKTARAYHPWENCPEKINPANTT